MTSNMTHLNVTGTITKLVVKDVRFPTSLELHGSDAMHKDPDYSAAYAMLYTDSNDGITGHGLAFSLGRGNELICKAMEVLEPYLVGKKLSDIYGSFGEFWHGITQDGQMRWLGPEKGVVHMAAAGVFNALWDLYAKKLKKPVWKLLADMSPAEIISLVDFSYLSDAMTKEDALKILETCKLTQKDREDDLLKNGYPAYTTHLIW